VDLRLLSTLTGYRRGGCRLQLTLHHADGQRRSPHGNLVVASGGKIHSQRWARRPRYEIAAQHGAPRHRTPAQGRFPLLSRTHASPRYPAQQRCACDRPKAPPLTKPCFYPPWHFSGPRDLSRPPAYWTKRTITVNLLRRQRSCWQSCARNGKAMGRRNHRTETGPHSARRGWSIILRAIMDWAGATSPIGRTQSSPR